MVITSCSRPDKVTVFKQLSKLRGSKFHHTHVDEHLTQRQTQARKARQATFQQLRQDGKRPYWRGTTLMVAGQEFTEDLAKRPSPSPPAVQAPSPTRNIFDPLSSSH